MKQINIYTDGACSGNPARAAGGAILEYKGLKKELSGGEKSTTNNRMELMAPHPRAGGAERTVRHHPVQRFKIRR